MQDSLTECGEVGNKRLMHHDEQPRTPMSESLKCRHSQSLVPITPDQTEWTRKYVLSKGKGLPILRYSETHPLSIATHPIEFN